MGSSAMPHLGQLLGSACRTSGCMGHVYLDFLIIDSNLYCLVIYVTVRGNREICRRRHALEHTPCKIKFRLMAGAEITANPVLAYIVRRNVRTEYGYATKVGT